MPYQKMWEQFRPRKGNVWWQTDREFYAYHILPSAAYKNDGHWHLYPLHNILRPVTSSMNISDCRWCGPWNESYQLCISRNDCWSTVNLLYYLISKWQFNYEFLDGFKRCMRTCLISSMEANGNAPLAQSEKKKNKMLVFILY